MAAGDINLLKTKTTLTPELLAVNNNLKMVSTLSIIVVTVVGIAIAGLYVTFSAMKTSQEERKKQLVAELTQEARKEGLLVSLHERLPAVEKALLNQHPWGPVLEYMRDIASPPNLTSATVDDQNIVSMTIKTGSIEETAIMVNTVTDLVRDRRIRTPQLGGLQVLRDGTVQLSLSFLPVF